MCGHSGKRVLQVTMATHVREEYWPLLGDGFRFCWTPTCEVIYYNNDKSIYFVKGELRTRFGPKESTSPRPICYCLQVTEEQIADEILKKKCCFSVEDIEYYTKAGTGKWCLTTNQSGKCCREYLDNIVDKYSQKVDTKQLKQQLESIKRNIHGEERAPKRKIVVKVDGMSCEGCAASISSILEHKGAKNVRVSFKEGTAEMITTPNVSSDDLVASVEQAGYRAKVLKIERI